MPFSFAFEDQILGHLIGLGFLFVFCFFLAKSICGCCFISSFAVYYAAVKPAGLGLVRFVFLN